MNTYDPADRIRYVHLAQHPGTDQAPPPARDACHRLPAGYANTALRARLGGSQLTDRPALVLLPGGSAPAAAPAPAGPALRLAR